MNIRLGVETSRRLREQAARDSVDPNELAEALLAEALACEEQDRAAMIEGIRRGLEASDAERVRPFSEFAREMRSRYALPQHLSDDELQAT